MKLATFSYSLEDVNFNSSRNSSIYVPCYSSTS